MTLGELRAMLKGLVNRDDMADEQADGYLRLSIARIQRKARIPCMERVYEVTAELPMEDVEVPEDMLGLIEVLVDGKPITPETHAKLLRTRATVGRPRIYSRFQNKIFLSPAASVGQTVSILYHGEFTAFASDEDDNEISNVAPDLVLYGAAAFAGSFFQHESAAEWSANFDGLLNELLVQAAETEMGPGPLAISATYPECDY